MKQSKQPGPRRARRPRRPSGGRGRSLLQPLIFLLICAALVLGMSVFFRVAKVEVVGNSIYTAEEVVEASGIGTGDNLFFINRFSAASRIFSKLPYVDKAKVTRALPNRVTITIQESSAMAYVQADDGYWVVDQNCKLLKSVTESELTGLARVDGITPVEPKVGEVLNAGDADAPKVTYLAAILGQLLTRDMASKVTVIDLSDASNPGFTYDGRFTVRLGANENVEYKFGMLQSAVSQLTDSDAGTIDLSIDKGEVVSIVGPSGAGKTTLLQILGTLSRPTSGEIEIDGVAVHTLSDKNISTFRNTKIGFVFQFHHLLPEFSAFENVCIPGYIAGRERHEVEKRAAELLGMLAMEHRLTHKPAELSGGEQQRVAIARALINSPAVLLADEPSGNLDTKNKEEIHKLFFTLRDTFGQTVVIVTHDEQLAEMSDRKIQMIDGLIRP